MEGSTVASQCGLALESNLGMGKCPSKDPSGSFKSSPSLAGPMTLGKAPVQPFGEGCSLPHAPSLVLPEYPLPSALVPILPSTFLPTPNAA